MTETEEEIRKIILDLTGAHFSNDEDGYRLLNAINKICSLLNINFTMKPPK